MIHRLLVLLLFCGSALAQVGTCSLVQSPNAVSFTNATSVTLPLTQTTAAGNLFVFIGQLGSSPALPTTLNAGGTLVNALGCTGPLGSVCSYVLPSTSTAVATSLVMNFSTTTGGTMKFYEIHPSANGANVGVDNEQSIVNTTSTTTPPGVGFTLGGTNDCITQGIVIFTNQSASAITSPYNAPGHTDFTTVNTNSAEADTPPNGNAPTWTLPSTDITWAYGFSFGWNVPAGKNQMFQDFEGGTNGNVPTTADLTGNLKGWKGCEWSVTGTAITYASAAALPLLNTSDRLRGDGGTYAAGSGSFDFGLRYTGTGTDINPQVGCDWVNAGVSTPLRTVSASVNFRSNLANTDTSNVDIFFITGSVAAINFMYQGNEVNRTFRLECNDSATNSAGTVTANQNTEYTLMLLFDAAGGTHRARVYDTTQTLVGSEMTCAAVSTNTASGTLVGNVGLQSVTYGGFYDFDSIKLDLDGTWPIKQ